MSRSYKGQTVLEYLIIATIIMAGIVIGGPFLAHSVSAHFRLLEDSTVDSVSEDIRQAALPNLPPGVCTCGDWTKGVCGNDPPDPCTPSQRLYQRSCNPVDCMAQQECRSEPDCCKTPNIVKCGTIIPDPPLAGSCPDANRPLPKALDAAGNLVDVFDPGVFKGVCPDSPSANCKIWERLYSISCGFTDPANPSASKTYYACKDVMGEANNCGPTCIDSADPNGAAMAGSAECDGDETSPSNLPAEILVRQAHTDVPWRPVTNRPSFPVLEMYNAYLVIITYFDPAVAHLSPTANGCAPGQPNYGTAACHRCDPSRRCEFVCPAGLYPMSASVQGIGVVENATCKPCRKGTTQVALYKYAPNDYDTLLYTSPHMPNRVTFHSVVNDAQNFAGAGIDSNDCHTEYYSNHGSNTLSNCYASLKTQFTVPGNSCGVYCANWGNQNTGSRFNANYVAPDKGGHNFALVLLRRNNHDSGISTQAAHIWWENPEYMICTENTLPVKLSSTVEGTLYSDGGGSKGAYIGYSLATAVYSPASGSLNPNPDPVIDVPRETSGTSYLYLDCSGFCTLSSPGVCFEVDGGPACTTPGSTTFSAGWGQKIKLTYPAT